MLGAGVACRRAASDGSRPDTASDPTAARAIDLVKRAHTLSPRMTNVDYINENVGRKANATIVGWRAQRYDQLTYLVTFTYVVPTADGGGEVYPFPFDVNLPDGRVRYILADPELNRKYGDKWWKTIRQ
jgi:hypothetical protein